MLYVYIQYYKITPRGASRGFACIVVPRKLETSASFKSLILNYFYKYELLNNK